ncbi:MAG: EamA family transporter [Rhizomicrobium sp.]
MLPRSGAASRAVPFAALGLSIVSVQFGASIAKQLFPAVGAVGTTTLRQTIAAIVLLLLFRPWRNPPPRETWPILCGYGVVLGLMNLVFYMALQRIPLGIAVAIEFTGPLAISTLGSRHWIDLLWVAMVAFGLLALLPLAGATQNLDTIGIALALAAGACWALYIVLGRRAGAAGTTQATAIGMTIAALVVLPVGAGHAMPAFREPSVLFAATAIAVLSSVIPYTCEMYALSRIPIRVFGVLMSLEPVVAALAGWIFLHEILTARQILAIAAIVAASLGTTLTMSRGTAAQDLKDHP